MRVGRYTVENMFLARAFTGRCNRRYEHEQDLWPKKKKKNALLEVFDRTAKTQFNEKRADMFDRFRVINSFNDAHTASYPGCQRFFFSLGRQN